MARKFNSNGIADGTLPGTKISSGSISASLVGSVRISSISITDNSYVVLDDTAVILTGGYIKILGTGFVSGCSVAIDTTIATSVSFVSATQLNIQVPAKAAGTYNIYLTTPTGAVAIRVNAITYSSTPTWVSTSPLPGGVNNTALSIQLGATSDSTISYTVQAGSTLPTGLSLTSGGLLSGTVTGLALETTYNFTVVATDVELQDSPKAFSITIIVNDPYFKNTVLLLNADVTPFNADISSNRFEVSLSGTPTPNANNPVQPGYYSGLFSSNYLTLAGSATNNFGTGDFTVEMWVNPSSLSSYNMIFAGGGYLCLLWGATSSVFGLNAYNGVQDVSSTTTTPINQWSHIAYVRVSGTIYFYINGISVGSAAFGSAFGTSSSVTLGYNLSYAGLYYFNGYLSNLRIVKGTAVYTGAFTPPTVPLAATQTSGTNIAAITGTTSLLTCQSYSFIDTSSTPQTITASGTPNISINQPFTLPSPYTGYGSGYFPGSSTLSTPSSTAFNIGAGDFTIECWWYFNSLPSGGINTNLYGFYGVTTFNPYLFLWGDGTIMLRTAQTGGDIFTPVAHGFVIKIWYHIVLVRSGNTYTVYRNGVSLASGTSTGVVNENKYLLLGDGGSSVNGYLSNLRVVKGVAVYTGAFTPPTGPLTTTQSSSGNIAAITGTATSLLTLQNPQAQNNNQFRDSSTNNFAVTRTGTPTQGTFTPFSQTGWSGYFNGAMSMSTPGAFNTAMVGLAGSLWTLELWLYVGAAGAGNGGGGGIIGTYDAVAANGRWIFYYAGTGPFTIGLGSTTSTGTQVDSGTTATFPLATWTHIAMTIDATTSSNSTVVLYINGVGQTFTGRNMSTQGTNYGTVTIGGNHSVYVNPLNGYINNLRFIKGALAYTGNFTPPTLASLTNAGATSVSAYSSTTNVNITFASSVTLLLTYQSNRFKDNSINNFDLGGGASVQAFSPFAPTTTYSAATVGGSMYFNGTTDYLTLPSNSALDLPSGDFTIEGWIYPIAAGQFLNKDGAYSVAYPQYALSVSGANKLQFDAGAGNQSSTPNTTYTGTTNITYNNWHHFAAVRTGTTIKLFLDGNQEVSTAQGQGMVSGGRTLDIALNRSSSLLYLNIYISNLRIVKGTAVYTAAFTPPTAPLTAITGTSLLLNATNSGIFDATGKNDLITVGDARVSTSVTKYGTGAMYFDGTGDYFQFPSSSQTLAFATGDFTVECWVNFATNNGTYNPFVRYDGSGTFDFGYDYSVTQLKYNGSGAIIAVSQTFTVGTWYHVALTRASGSSKLFVNGTQVGSTATGDTNNYASGAFKVGGSSYSGSHVMSGYIDDLRITKGIARYTTTFTPPSQAMLGM